MQWLKQSTAVSKIVGPILDSTGAEYASAVIGDLSLSKNGGTLTALAATATLTYIANGMYTLALTTGNTDTLGSAEVSCNKATYQMPPREFMVLPATVYDALVTNAAGGANGLVLSLASNQVNVGQFLGSATPVTNLNTVFNTDYATVYDTTNKAFLSKLGNFAMGGSSLALTTGAISGTTLTLSGAVAFQSTFAVTGTTTLAALNTGSIAVTGTLSTSGTTTFNAFTVTNALTVSGTTTLTGAVTASNASNNIGGVTLVAAGLANVTAWTVNITGSLSGSVGSVSGNVGGNVVGSVGSVATGVDISTGSGNALVAATAAASASAVTTDHGVGSYIRNTEPPTAAANASAVRTELTVELGRIDAAVTTRPTLAQILAGGDVDGFTIEETMKLCLAALAGKLSGAATTTITIRAADDSKARLTATVDSDGNRSAITYDATG